jgi:hypothetical protein
LPKALEQRFSQQCRGNFYTSRNLTQSRIFAVVKLENAAMITLGDSNLTNLVLILSADSFWNYKITGFPSFAVSPVG